MEVVVFIVLMVLFDGRIDFFNTVTDFKAFVNAARTRPRNRFFALQILDSTTSRFAARIVI